MELTDNEVEFIEVALEGQKAEIESLKSENNELKRLLAMQSDLDLQGYEHMRDELQELHAKLAASEQRVKALEDALCAIADGRGMVPDKSTIYMNGRNPEIPKIFNKHDMQEIANKALEATCQR